MKLVVLCFAMLVSACQPSLDHQPRTKPLSASAQFVDDSSARPQVAGTIAFSRETTAQPLPNMALLILGQQKYEINCAVCHGYTGEGNGLITQRGYPILKNYVDEGVLKKSNGTLYAVVFDGKNQMPAFGAKLNPQEIWALVHYVRVLALRSHAPANLLSVTDRQQLQEVSR